MLVLSRKVNQQITIDENITVTVVRLKGGVVRIGIEAPDNVSIRRSELKAVSDDASLQVARPRRTITALCAEAHPSTTPNSVAARQAC